MIKRIGGFILTFIVGLIISFLAESTLRDLIQYLFRVSTNHAIHFVGKDFHFFASPFYYASFGLLASLFWLTMIGRSVTQNLIAGLLTVSIFLLSLIIINFVDSNSKIVACTACADGTFSMHYNDINYDGIIITSLVLAMIPSAL